MAGRALVPKGIHTKNGHNSQVSDDHRSYEPKFKQLCIEAWKSQDFNGVWTRDLAIPVRRSNQLSYEATDVGTWSFVSSNEPVREEWMWSLTCSGFYTQLLKFAFITAMIIGRNSDKHLETFTQILPPPIRFTSRRCSDFILIISGRDYILSKRVFGSWCRKGRCQALPICTSQPA